MKNFVWLDIIIIIAWSVLFGTGVTYLDPNNTFLEFVAVVSGASVGVLVSWSIRYLAAQLKNKQ